MIDIIVGIALTAMLFALFGAIKYRGCTGHCAGCTGACGRNTDGVDHDR
jgi:hypothetical protein